MMILLSLTFVNLSGVSSGDAPFYNNKKTVFPFWIDCFISRMLCIITYSSPVGSSLLASEFVPIDEASNPAIAVVTIPSPAMIAQ